MIRSLRRLFQSGETIESTEQFGEQFIDVRDLIGFSVVTPMGIIGEIEDFAVEEPLHSVVFVIVNTNDMFIEDNLLVKREYVADIDFQNKYLRLTTTIDEIRGQT